MKRFNFKKNNSLCVKIVSVFIAGLLFLPVFSQAPKVQYLFNTTFNNDSVKDESGNGYNAKLVDGAKIKKSGRFGLLQTGASSGYVDLTAKTGQLIASLSDFTISTYLYIDPSVVLSNNGNFVWTFSNSANILSSAKGCMFYSAKESRFAICTTNYSTEKVVSIGAESAKGTWKHIAYTQSGQTGSVYIDGVLQKTGTINLLPSRLGATPYNYLCKSSYAGDQLLLNSMLYDFRIYNSALNSAQIAALSIDRAALDTTTYNEQVDSVLTNLSPGNLSALTSNLTLPVNGDYATVIQWASSNTAVISNSGVVFRPAAGSPNAVVTLTATVSRNFISKTKTFTATVLPYYSDRFSVETDSAHLELTGHLNNLRSALSLPSTGNEGSVISWSSDKPAVLSSTGAIVSRPAHGSGNTKVTLTATLKKGQATVYKTFNIYVAEDEGYSAYLFAYFTGNSGNQEAIRFAVSDDGFTFKALNNNNPILSSAAISSSGGVRDPHILRGENNDYYMVVTDMVSALGWNSNRAMVLLKSTNLTDWSSSVVNIPNTYPEYAAADRVWAPQSIYDPVAQKYMIYFSMKLGSSDTDKIYYAYANSSFTALETAPKLLFDNGGLSTIDADIVLKDGVYNMFFKTEGNGNGIKKATSNDLTKGYVLYDKYLQSTGNAVEGGCVYRMYNSDNWILMYDMYTSGAYQFTISPDLINFSVVPNDVSFDFTPRHGTIIPITLAEKQRLNSKWGVTNIVASPLQSAMSVYPNPATKYINLTTGNIPDSELHFSIYDYSGKKVQEGNISQELKSINVSSLSPGLYTIRCSNTHENFASKFIKK